MNLDELWNSAYRQGYNDCLKERETGITCKVSPEAKDKASLIIEIVCKYFTVTWEAIVEENRKREILIPRQVCMFFLSYYSELPLKAIGKLFGGKDHTTVAHAKKVVEDLSNNNIEMRMDIQKLADVVYKLAVLNESVTIEAKPIVPKSNPFYHKNKALTMKRVVVVDKLPMILREKPPAIYSNSGHINLIKEYSKVV